MSTLATNLRGSTMDPFARLHQLWTGRQARHPPPIRYRVFLPYIYLTSATLALIGGFVALRPLVPLAALQGEAGLTLVLALALTLQVGGGLIISLRVIRPLLDLVEADRARLMTILSSISDGVVLRDSHGDVILANPAAVRLLSTKRGFRPEVLKGIGGQAEGEVQRLELEGRTLAVSIGEPIAGGGLPVGEVLVLRDMTRETLVERTKDSFLDHIGHELRTPLTVIKGYADIMRLGGDRLRPEARERAISAILEQTITLARMIDDIIDMTSLRNSGRLALRPQPLDLNALVDDLLVEWATRFAAARLTPTFERAAALPMIEADPRRLRQALEALLHNACRFSPQGGPLRLRTEQVGGGVCVHISDPGVGISAEDLPHIFDRFFRGTPINGAGEALDVRGIGQGLYAVKTIVEAHGGRVTVESAPGQGSTFSVWLPLAVEE